MLLEFFHELVAGYAFSQAGKHTVVAGYGAKNFVHVEVIEGVADCVCVAWEGFDYDNVS